MDRSPTLFRNDISFAGAVIMIAALASILLLFLIELTQSSNNPYLGLVRFGETIDNSEDDGR